MDYLHNHHHPDKRGLEPGLFADPTDFTLVYPTLPTDQPGTPPTVLLEEIIITKRMLSHIDYTRQSWGRRGRGHQTYSLYRRDSSVVDMVLDANGHAAGVKAGRAGAFDDSRAIVSRVDEMYEIVTDEFEKAVA